MALDGQPGRDDVALARLGDPSPAAAYGEAGAGSAVSLGTPTRERTVGGPPRSRFAEVFSGQARLRTLLVADVLVLVLAVGTALQAQSSGHDLRGGPDLLVWIFPPLVLTLLAIRGMYRARITLRVLDQAMHLVGASSVAAMLVLGLSALVTDRFAAAGPLTRIWLFAMVSLVGERFLLGIAERRARVVSRGGKPTLIVGAGRVGAQVERRLEQEPAFGLRPVGFIDAFPTNDPTVSRTGEILGTPDELEEVIKATGAEHVILAFLSSRGADARLVPIARKCAELGVEVSLVPRLFESINVRVSLDHIGGLAIFRLRAVRPHGWEFGVKHVIDRFAAAALLVLFSPVIVAAAIAVKLSSSGPVFFRQRRVGRDGHVFDLLKFRSMRTIPQEQAKVSVLVPDDTAPGGVEGMDRRTLVGRVLRRLSIDELPQLFNVLKGDMSIVGPRPERSEFVELFERRVDRYDDRHRVKSGITGWAQVHGLRGKTSLRDRIELDNFYIENWSLGLDFKILLLTVGALFHAAE